ncbi:hypothetical protein ACEPAI_1641 [Sanghuangporus weigelae]
MAAAATSSQPISIISRDPQRSANDNLNIPSLHFAGSPMNTSSSSSFLAHPSHLANPRYAGTSPRSAESSTSWSIHPGPLFVSAGSLGSTSGSLGANSISGSAGSFRNRMYPGPGCSPASVLNPLEPEFKFRGIVGSLESDHGSLIDAHMAQREVEQFRDFTCCGLSLRDLHALVEHFESHHVHVVDPTQPLPHPHPQSAFEYTPIPMYPGDPGYGKSGGSVNGTATGSGSASSDIPTSTDSSLAGALGPSSSTTAPSNDTANPTGSASSGFDLDDIDMEMDPEPEHDEPATSPAPSASSSSNHSCNSNPNSSSNRSSPLGGGAGPLPLTQPQRFANANGGIPNGTRSSVSSPPDTPLLTTPVSPYATASATQTTFPWASGVQGQGQDGLVGLASNIQSQQGQVQVPAGPPAFDNVTLPAKHIHGGNGIFAHPYANASSARRHYTHPLSPLSSASTSAATSPASASSSSTFAFGNQSQQQRTGLHHTQSLYALRLARHVAEQREREREDLMKRALNGYAGYEDYSRGFPGASSMDTINGGIAGAGGVQCTATGLASVGGMERMSVGPTETAIHPGLLFGNGNANANGDAGTMTNGGVKTEPGTARTTPAQSRSGSPSSPSSVFASASASSTLASTSTSTAVSTPGTSTPSSTVRKAPSAGSSASSSSSVLPRSTSSLLLSKPFKCPTLGCTKSYKQANGLKYHVTHGQCSFTPPPELSSISELGLSIGVHLKLGPMGLEGLENMSEAERREAEKEAERRLRPFCCQVKPCTRRYKNMNGLRYHYQHSGEHGMIGLRMLASGRHDATREQSAERSDEEGEGGDGEGGDAAGGERGNTAERRSVERTGSAERGRRRERKERSMGHAGQTSSAPSTPGPSHLTAASAVPKSSPFTTQAFPGFVQHLQQPQQQSQQQHQRSLSGSSGQQQPRSPLSQAFSAQTAAFAQGPFANMNAPTNGFVHMNGGTMNGMMNGMNGVNGVNAMNQYAFAVQSQPASAYASPWGSRAGSPTSSGAV